MGWQEPLLQAAGPLCQTVGDAVAGSRSHTGQQEPRCASPDGRRRCCRGHRSPMRRMDRQESCCGQQELRWWLGVRWEELLPRAAGAVTSSGRRRCCARDTVQGSRSRSHVAAVPRRQLLRVANSRARHVQRRRSGRQEALCCRNCCARRQEPLRWCGRNRCCGEPLLRAAGVATLCGRSRSAEKPLSGRKRGAHTQWRSTRVRVMRVLVGGHIRNNGVPKEHVLSQQLRRQHKPRLAWSQPPWCTALSCRRSTLMCPLKAVPVPGMASATDLGWAASDDWRLELLRLTAGDTVQRGPHSGRFQGVVGHPTFLFARVRGRIETVRFCAKTRHFSRGGKVHIWSGQFVVALSRVADSYVAHEGLDTARPICLPSGALRQISSGRCYKVQPGTHTSEEGVEVCLSVGTLGKVWVFVTSGNFGPS